MFSIIMCPSDFNIQSNLFSPGIEPGPYADTAFDNCFTIKREVRE